MKFAQELGRPVFDLEGLRKLPPTQVLATVRADGTLVPGLSLPEDLERHVVLPPTVRAVIQNTLVSVGLFTGAARTVELVGGKMERTEGPESASGEGKGPSTVESYLAALRREALQEAGVRRLETIRSLGIVVECKKPVAEPAGAPEAPRIKVAYGFMAHAPEPLGSWSAPAPSEDELGRAVSVVYFPNLENVERAMRGSPKGRILRDWAFVRKALDLPI